MSQEIRESPGQIGFFGTEPTVQPDGVSAEEALNTLGLGVNLSGASDPEVVPATEMNAVSATAGENSNSGIGIPVVSFADAATQRANGTKRVPTDWTTADVKLKWTHPSTGTGDVIWRLYTYLIGDGDTIDATNGDYTNHGNVTVTAPAEDTSAVATLKSGLALTSGKSVGWTIMRRGSEAGDTLAEAAEAIELIFEKAS